VPAELDPANTGIDSSAFEREMLPYMAGPARIPTPEVDAGLGLLFAGVGYRTCGDKLRYTASLSVASRGSGAHSTRHSGILSHMRPCSSSPRPR